MPNFSENDFPNVRKKLELEQNRFSLGVRKNIGEPGPHEAEGGPAVHGVDGPGPLPGRAHGHGADREGADGGGQAC